MELGLATFADLSSGVTPEQRMRDLIEEAVLADQLGLDVFAVGEHHRPDFLVSSPAVALAAIAARTERIRLSSAVTVLSSDDPVRVFQQFAELDLISGGRAEIMAGRGSFIESFPLFGYDLDDYDELYAEKLELLLKIRESTRVDLVGPAARAAARRRRLAAPGPGPAAGLGGGGRLAAVGRAGGDAGPAADAGHHRRPARALRAADRALPPGRHEAGHDAAALPVAINTHAFVGRDLGRRRRGLCPALPGDDEPHRTRARLAAGGPGRVRGAALPRGAVAAGSPEQVAEKILFEHELFGNTRYIAQMSVGAVKHADVLRSMELFGTQVAPVVRAEVARRTAAPPPAGA